jgi:hypothetical protein
VEDEPSPPGGAAPADLLAELVRCPAPTVSFASGRSVTLEDGASERLVVRSAEGAVELAVRFTPEGPVLSFSAAALDLRSSGTVRLACGKLEVDAREGIAVHSAGDVRAEVRGDHHLTVGGASHTEADALAIHARLGDVAIKANDDVRIDGERVRLND